MTLHEFAVKAISREIRLRFYPYIYYTPERALNIPAIAAWMVWSMRGTPDAKQDYKTFNKARRVLQRAGYIRI